MQCPSLCEDDPEGSMLSRRHISKHHWYITSLVHSDIVNHDLSQLLTTSTLENSQNMYKNVQNTQDVKKCQNFTK